MASKLTERVLSPSIPGRFVLDMLEGFRCRGGDVDALLRLHSLSSERLLIEGYRVSVNTYATLLNAVAEQLQDEALGFLESPLPIRSYAVFCSGLSGKQSLAEVLTFYQRFYSLFSQQFQYHTESGGEGLVIAVDCDEPDDLDYRFLYQSLLLSLVRLLGWLLGIKLIPRSVSFTFTARDYEEHLGYLFDCPIAPLPMVRSEIKSS